MSDTHVEPKMAELEDGSQAEGHKRPYVRPAVESEEQFERYALQACGGKDGGCGPFMAS